MHGLDCQLLGSFHRLLHAIGPILYFVDQLRDSLLDHDIIKYMMIIFPHHLGL